jgi:hypothetical protein
LELQQVFEEAVLKLKVLWAEERAFGPDDWLEAFHCVHSSRLVAPVGIGEAVKMGP